MSHGVHLPGCAAASTADCRCEERRYSRIFWITVLIATIQFVGSALSGSLALLADTLHVLLDGASALISVHVARQVRTHHDPAGFRIRWMKRSAWLLLIALAWVAYEAIGRFRHPVPVNGWEVMPVAFIGMVLNAWQHRLVPHDHSVTATAQRLHVLGDLGSSAMVLVGGGLMLLTGRLWIDPVLSLLVVVVIGYPTLKMLMSRHADTGCGHSH